MARRDSITWFMLGVAQLLLGEALLEAGSSELLAQVIQLSGGGTIALGIYFLIFLARHESEFSEAYNRAEKMVLQVNPEGPQGRVVRHPNRDDPHRAAGMAGCLRAQHVGR